MFGREHFHANRHAGAELFEDLAGKRVAVGLTIVHLPAREFPKALEMNAWRSPRDEKAPLTFDDRRDYGDHRERHRLRPVTPSVVVRFTA